MSTWIELLMIIIGIAVMLYGADLLVSKAEKLGRSKGWPPILVGIVVIAVGTSLPELIVSVLASLQGHVILAAANVIGSNITNIALIVGLAALLGEIHLTRKAINYDIPLSIAPLGVLVFGYIFNSTLTSFLGLLLILAYMGYIGITAHEYEVQSKGIGKRIIFTKLDGGLLLAGIAMLLGGAEITLHNSVIFFSRLGVSEIVVGSVILAFGTSLPELVATLIAVVKKEGGIAVGNILGSNVFNILFGLGISSIIAPIKISLLGHEIMFLGVISAVFVVITKTGRRHVITRSEGAILCMLYAIYVGTITLFVK